MKSPIIKTFSVILSAVLVMSCGGGKEEDEFKFYKQEGLGMGFTVVESGALVRSSYHADEQARLAKVV